jgi:hypothetical protein
LLSKVERRTNVKYVVIGVGALLACFALGWVIQGNDFFMYKVFAPKYEQVRRETYEQTKSYKQGSAQRLNTLCAQIASADDAHKPMLRDVVAHEFAEWDMADVPSYLHSCLMEARRR